MKPVVYITQGPNKMVHLSNGRGSSACLRVPVGSRHTTFIDAHEARQKYHCKTCFGPPATELVEGEIFCDFHGECHPDLVDYYQCGEGGECNPDTWRKLWVQPDV